MIHSSAVHQLTQGLGTENDSSGSHSSIVNVFETTRVPGCRFSSVGRSCRLMLGNRNIVMTVAFDRSVLNKSACWKVALADTPSASAFFFDSATMSGLYSMPTAVAPRLAAVMTV